MIHQIITILAIVTAGAVSQARSYLNPETFKMYSQRNPQVHAFCDMYTELVLTIAGDKAEAKIQDRLAGNCEIFVDPNPRSYQLQMIGTDCGSKTFILAIEATSDSTSTDHVRLVDHRSRVCQDLQPNRIVLTEPGANGSPSTLYSFTDRQ